MHNEPTAFADFETRSAVPLSKKGGVGSWKYSLHPTTEILCMAFRLPHWDEGEVYVWHPAFPQIGLHEYCDDWDKLYSFLEWVDAGELVEAHNAWFERGIWANVLVPHFRFPSVDHRQWRCSAAKAAALALPRKLEKVGPIMHLPFQKDETGSKLMMKMNKPRKPRKAEREAWAREHGDAPMPLLWHESPELLSRLCDYCKIDVLTEAALSDVIPDLSPDETEMYLLDQAINERGIGLDPEAIDAALATIDLEVVKLTEELVVLTDGQVEKATNRAKMKVWLSEQGVDVENMQGATLDALLDSEDAAVVEGISAPARRAIEITRMVNRSSTAKYAAMRDWMCPDNRAHGTLLYHGASSGRWTSAGPQFQNFPRGTIHQTINGDKFVMDDLWDWIKAFEIEKHFGTGYAMEVLAGALRGAIIPSEGKQFYVADYAGIEARVLLWLAGDEEGMDIFRQGRDIYCEMASDIYQRPITKADKDERQLGKAAILGCMGADTPVLTRRGWVSIIDVTQQDQVWDGVEWVSHDGCIYQGFKETLCLAGLTITPDHLIHTPTTWVTAQSVAADDVLYSQSLVHGGENLPLEAMRGENGAESQELLLSAPVNRDFILSRNLISNAASQPAVISVPKSRASRLVKSIWGMLTSWQMTKCGPGYSTELVPFICAAKTQTTRDTAIMGAGVSESTLRGVWDWAMGVGVEIRRESGLFWNTLQHYPVGTNKSWNWTARITTKDTNREICGSLPAKPTWKTAELSDDCKSGLTNWNHVYDLVNAGPRNRFTVLTADGPVIVHNCGYQMGWSKFIATALMLGRVVIDEETSKRTVAAYRAKFWRVKAMWDEQGEIAIEATRSPGKPLLAGRVEWVRDGRFLYCTLPSGRRLAYADPQVHQKETPWGEMRPSLSFMGVNPLSKQWQRQHGYGGLWVQNETQADARDLMAYAMLACEQEGKYLPVLSVHDELICEAPIGVGSVDDFVKRLTAIPQWAQGCPIDAEGWVGTRYRK